ncbi:hypothetical protein ACWCXX_33500 [Streptomyces sp. NPDC001732]
MKPAPGVFGEASDRDLGELLARPGAGDSMGGYDIVLVASPGFGNSLPVEPEPVRRVGPHLLELPRPGQDQGLGREPGGSVRFRS